MQNKILIALTALLLSAGSALAAGAGAGKDHSYTTAATPSQQMAFQQTSPRTDVPSIQPAKPAQMLPRDAFINFGLNGGGG